VQNGGVVSRELAVFPTCDGGVTFEDLRGVGPGRETVASADVAAEWGVPERLVPLTGDGHTWIALDYRDGDEPSVTYVDVELDREQPLAPTLRAFLEGLGADDGPPPDPERRPPRSYPRRRRRSRRRSSTSEAILRRSRRASARRAPRGPGSPRARAR
jgi:hypothetical protein